MFNRAPFTKLEINDISNVVPYLAPVVQAGRHLDIERLGIYPDDKDEDFLTEERTDSSVLTYNLE